MPGFAFVILTLVIGFLLLAPTRRLFVSGQSSRLLSLYFFGMLALGMLVAEWRGPARFLVPVLVVGYIAPFVTGREGISRLLNGRRGGPTVPPRAGGTGGRASGPAGRSSGPAGRSSARNAGSGAAPGTRPPMKNVTPPEARTPTPEAKRP